jgi:PAS domain S-box-containing protein
MSKTLRVLVLEDSPDDSALVLRALRHGGYDVTAARVETAEEMQAALDAGSWDVVIADYTMPRFSAPTALELLKARGLDLPFIIVSGSIGEETAVAAMKLGAHDYVMKDNPARLVPVIEREVREAEGRRERKRAEDLSSRLGRILDGAPVEIYVFDADTFRFTLVNRTARENLGYSMAELTAMQPVDLAPEFDGARLRALRERLRGGQLEQAVFETTARRKDGSLYPVEVRLELSRAETPPVFVAIVEDVSVRKRAEEERAQLVREQMARADAEAAERRSAFLAEASRLLAVSLDYPTTLVKVARLAVPALADWCVVDMLEDDARTVRRVAVVHQDPDRVRLVQGQARLPDLGTGPGVGKVLRTGEPELYRELSDTDLATGARNLEHLTLLRDLKPASLMIVPLAARGRTLGAITFVTAESAHRYGEDDLAFAQDLARRAALAIDNARLFAEAQEADRRKDQFLAILGHELRNPLAAICSAIEVLWHVSASEERATRQRAIIERQARQLTRLVDDLLDVARITSGKITLQRRPVDLAQIASRSLESMRAALDVKRHEVALEAGGEPLVVDGDPARLEQVVVNLLDNAIKYTPPGGRIRLSLSREGDEGVVRLWDSGIGIPRDALRDIFGLFTQGRHAAEDGQVGLGLGLALVEKLVGQHGGQVTADSAGSGQGSEFVVRLPLARDGAMPEQPPRPEGPSRPRHVLIVDDNADGREALGALLELWENRVEMAENGTRGVEKALEMRPDVALIDIGLPDINGYEVAQRLRGAGILLVAVTGYGQPEDHRRALEAGFDAHLVKPIDPERLAHLLGAAPGDPPQSAVSSSGSSDT